MKKFTVRDAYDHVFKREYEFATFKGLSIDEANRFANKMAVKYTWREFHHLTAIRKYIESTH